MKKNLKEKLKKLSIVISSHVSASGPALDLEEYLKDKAKSLLFIGHPFSAKKGTPSFFRSYGDGCVKEGCAVAGRKLPEGFVYIKEAVYTFLWVLKKKSSVDLYIGSDNFLAYLGLLLKTVGKVKKVVFYTIDYVPERFDNSILNKLYHFFDRQCVKKADIVWNLSEKIAEARKDYQGLEGDGLAEQIVVPVGIWLERTRKNRRVKREKDRIVFLGHLIKKQGLQVVIDAMAELSRKFSKAKLIIIGTGSYGPALKRRVKKNSLQEKVLFLGFIEDHKQVEKELAKASIAVATYVPIPESFTYFTDPGKIKSYLAAGLPVVLTDVPQIAKDLVKKKCGLITNYDTVSICETITELLSDETKLSRYSKNALKYASNFDWNEIFENALENSI